MTLAAGLIVVLIGRLFNRLALNIGVRPGIKFQPIKPDPLFAYGEFVDVRAHRLVKFFPTHAEVGRRMFRPDEARRGL